MIKFNSMNQEDKNMTSSESFKAENKTRAEKRFNRKMIWSEVISGH